MVEEHAHRDLGVAGVCHGEIREIGGDRLIQVYFPLLHQLHHGGGGIGLADGADAVQVIIGERAVLRLGVDAVVPLEGDLSVLPKGVLDTDGAAILHGVLGGLMGGLGPVLLCGGGGQGQREGKDQRQEQGGPSAAKVYHRIFLSDMEVGFIIAEARALSREWKAENCAYFSTILSSDHSQRTIFLKTEKI